MKQLFIIGMGGFLGTIARFGVSKLNVHWHFFSIPIGTLIVNVVGSFIIGLVISLSQKNGIINTNLQLFLTVGICGGFTTFSSFSMENMQLIQNGQIMTALFYATISIIAGFIAVYLGSLSSTLF